jgi:hypothetical protein
MDRALACAKNAVAMVSTLPVPEAEVSDQLTRILQEKNVLAEVRDGRMTKEQGSNLVVAELESWALQRCGQTRPATPKWDLSMIAEDLESALFEK